MGCGTGGVFGTWSVNLKGIVSILLIIEIKS